VLDKEEFRCVNVVFCLFTVVSHVQAYGLEGVGPTACGKQGHLILSIGLEWRAVRSLALKVTAPSKGHCT
jgi:hypothetical protein